MLTEDDIKNLNNLELRKKLIEYQIKCGPVESSTRGLYEKKLIKHLKAFNAIKQTEVIPGVNNTSPTTTANLQKEIRMDINNNEEFGPVITVNTGVQQQQENLPSDDLDNLSNDEILALLRQNNIPCGPISPTTRSVYIKKLKKHLTQQSTSILIDNDNAQVPSLSFVKQETTQTEPEVIIIEDTATTPKTSHASNTSVNKPIKKLEFKLLKPPAQLDEIENEEAEYQPQTFKNQSFDDLNRSYTRSTTNFFNSNRSADYDLHNRLNRKFDEQFDYVPNRNKPLIKLSNLFDKKHDNYSTFINENTHYAQNFPLRQGIYSEPAPPQPVHIYKINNNQQSSLLKLVNQYKTFLFIGVILLLIVFYSLWSSEPINPIENI